MPMGAATSRDYASLAVSTRLRSPRLPNPEPQMATTSSTAPTNPASPSPSPSSRLESTSHPIRVDPSVTRPSTHMTTPRSEPDLRAAQPPPDHPFSSPAPAAKRRRDPAPLHPHHHRNDDFLHPRRSPRLSSDNHSPCASMPDVWATATTDKHHPHHRDTQPDTLSCDARRQPSLKHHHQHEHERQDGHEEEEKEGQDEDEDEEDEDDDDDDDDDDDVLVPSVFTWNFGGHDVFVAGAWDQWQTKTPLYKSAHEHIALMYIPCGEYEFKYFVDDNWQCAPNFPTRTDANGNTNNVVTIKLTEQEFDNARSINDRGPPSPLSSYDQMSNAQFSSDPPILPPHLEARVLKPLPEDISPSIAAASRLTTSNAHSSHMHRSSQSHPPDTNASQPASADRPVRPFFSHVFIDHLYVSPPVTADGDVRCLSQTTRVRGKVVSTVFVTNKSPAEPGHRESNGFRHHIAT